MSDTPAIDRALADVAHLVSNHGLDPQMARRARDVIGLLFRPDTCYASISPIDDGDLSFYWVAGDRSISVDLCADGGVWQCVLDRHGRATYEGGGVRREVAEALAAFSAHVESVNPAWREMTR